MYGPNGELIDVVEATQRLTEEIWNKFDDGDGNLDKGETTKLLKDTLRNLDPNLTD